MTQAAEEILQKALELPEEDRDRIADSLWRSVHGGTAESIAEEWTMRSSAASLRSMKAKSKCGLGRNA